MSFYPLRRIQPPNISPLVLYFKGLINTFLALLLTMIGGLIYFLYVNQEVYYYSFTALIAIIFSVFLGGYTSGKTEKGWLYGMLVGITYGLIFVFIEDFLSGNISVFNFIKFPIILAVFGVLGGSMGYRFRLSRIRYNIRRRGINNY